MNPSRTLLVVPVLASLLAACSAETSGTEAGADEADDAVRIGACVAGTGVPSQSYFSYFEEAKEGPKVRGKLGDVLDMGNHTAMDVYAGALIADHSDFSLCGNKVKFKDHVRGSFHPEGLDLEVLATCAEYPNAPACGFTEPCVKGTIDIAAGSCEIKKGYPVELRTLDIACVAGGTYCGGDKITGDAATLYRCTAGNRGEVVKTCANGCSVRAGQDDKCFAEPLATANEVKGLMEAFYKEFTGSPLGSDAEKKYVDADYLRDLARQNLNYNPFVCGQDFASKIVVDRPTVSGSYATVLVHHRFSGTETKMAATVDLGSRKIVNTQCLFGAGVVGTH